jgi:hypothetical protein
MIAKGNRHSDGTKLARYLITGKDGERAELAELRGFESADIVEAFRSIHVMADSTRCKRPFFHVQVRNPAGEDLSAEQRTRIINRIETKLGLSGQARAVALHVDEKTGEIHIHVAWSLIDENTLKARPLPFFKTRLKEVCRELELKLALIPVTNQRDSEIKFAPTKAEEEQARRLGVDIHDVRETIRACYDRSDCGRSFQQALEYEGLILAQGDRRDYLVLDEAGGLHALGKKVLGATASQVRAKLGDIERDQLPTLEQAREQVLTRELGHVQKEIVALQESAPVWDRDAANRAWEDAVVNAAIQNGTTAKDEQKHGGREQRTVESTGAAQQIREAHQHSDNPQAFISALEDHGIGLAQATRADAVQSQLDSAEATIAGHWKPTFREGEVVAITEQGQVWKLTERTTGDKDIQKFLSGLTAPLPSIQDARHQKQRERELEAAKAEPELNKTAGNIRLAYNLASGPEAFKEFLQRDGLTAARVTAQDIHDRDSGKQQREKDDILRILRNPEQIWMLQTGGVDALSAELGQRAAEAYERWSEEKPELAEKYDFGNYVGYVQTKWGELARQHNIDVTKEQPPPSSPETEKKPRSLSGYAREGDIVILDRWGNAYELTERTTGNTRQDAQAFLAGIGQLPAIEDARRKLEENRRFGYEPPIETDIDLGKAAGNIRLAYNLTNGPEQFREQLQQDGLTFARVTWQDIRERDSQAQQENRRAAIGAWDKAKPQILDAEQSLPAAPEPGKPSGRLSDHAREGDIVILDKWGNAYELNQRTTGSTRQDAQAFMAGIGGYLPSVSHARRELEEQCQRPIQLPTGSQHGGMVAQQMWAVRRLQNAAQDRHEQQRRSYEQQRRNEDRRQREEATKSTGDIDPQRYLTDPDYRRQVRTERAYQTPAERQTEKENNVRALLEQQDRQR